MPRLPSLSNTSKTKKTSKHKTFSFVCEVPLRVTDQQERILAARFEAARQLYNALLGEAKKRLSLVRQSIWYTKAKKSTDKKERQAHFSAARQAHGFSAYALEAVQKVSFGNARKVRFKGKRGLHSLEGKMNAACIRWREDRVLWNGFELPMIKGVELDPVIQHGLSSRVKYVRLVRQDIHGNARYYAQLVCEGIGF